MKILTAKRNELEIVQPKSFTFKKSERLILSIAAIIGILFFSIILFVYPFLIGNITEQNLDQIRLYQRDIEELNVYIKDINQKINYYVTMNESVGF